MGFAFHNNLFEILTKNTDDEAFRFHHCRTLDEGLENAYIWYPYTHVLDLAYRPI